MSGGPMISRSTLPPPRRRLVLSRSKVPLVFELFLDRAGEPDCSQEQQREYGQDGIVLPRDPGCRRGQSLLPKDERKDRGQGGRGKTHTPKHRDQNEPSHWRHVTHTFSRKCKPC